MNNLGLPEEVTFCKKCVISNQRPQSSVEHQNKSGSLKKTIKINDDGICDACKYNEIKTDIDWEKRSKELETILEKYRRNDGYYDCIVPSSGGKDSSFTAHILKYKYGMNPLTVTWSPTMYTEVGLKNQSNLTDIGGLDNILYSINGRLHRVLTKIAFENLGHPFQPFIHGQKLIGPRLALKLGIPLIIYGENQAEYGNSIENNYSPIMDPKFYTVEKNKRIYLGGLTINEICSEYGFRENEFAAFQPLTPQEVASRNISQMYLGYFEKWDPQECYYYASENTGFQAAPERSEGTYSKYTEIDDKMIPFHFYTLLAKFGIGRATYDACQEIRNGKITREEGVNLVEKYDTEFPALYYEDFKEYIGVSDEEFEKTIDLYRSEHLWVKVKNQWKLRYNVAGTGYDQ